MKKRTKRIFTLLFAAGILVSGTVLIKEYGSDYIEAQKLSALSNSIVENTSADIEEGGAAAQQALTERYAALHDANPDFLGWIKIAGTEVNYPVMHTPEDPTRYLRRDFYGAYSQGGVPFLDGACNASMDNPTDNWIIYGHNMNSSTMFSSILKYAQKEYWTEHPVIQFDTMERRMRFEVVGAFYSKIYMEDEVGFCYYNFRNADTQDEYDAFISEVKANALYDTGIEAVYGDQLLTLSTCSFHTENGRFVLVARESDKITSTHYTR